MTDKSETRLKKAIIHLAHENPDGIREHLVPVLRRTAAKNRKRILRLLEENNSLCLDDDKDRKALAAALVADLGGSTKAVLKLLEKHESRCTDDARDRAALANALAKDL